MNGVDPVAATGFERGAAAYERGRPGYPDAILDWLRGALDIRSDASVVEIGAGTGLFTQQLARTGATVVAVDPVPAMLDRLRRAMPSLETLSARADTVPLPDESVDAIVCATAFHWFATGAVLAEFRRLLRPGGALGLVWNVRDERVPWVAALSAITNRHAGDIVRQRDETWRTSFPAPGFSPLIETMLPYDHRGSAEEVIVDRTLSTSFIAALDTPTHDAVVREVRGLIAATPEVQGTTVAFPYVTKAYHCRRLN